MPWWGWMIFGAILIGSELMIVDAGFYLVFIGIAAALTGLIELAGLGLEPWLQWAERPRPSWTSSRSSRHNRQRSKRHST